MRPPPIALALGALVAGLLTACTPEQPSGFIDAPAVEVEQGLIIGSLEDGLRTYKAIPYAAPPLGEGRWSVASALSAPAADQPSNSLEPASPCVQIGHPIGIAPKKRWGKVIGSEDCLYLSIQMPANAAGQSQPTPLPVYIWLTGGAYDFGNPDIFRFNALVKKGVIVVKVEHRRGILGFFTASDSARSPQQGERQRISNFALTDVLAAYRWVAENIASFGGDPQSITLGGNGSGATLALALLSSPLYRQAIRARHIPPFHGLVLHSPTVATLTRTTAENDSRTLIDSLRRPTSSASVVSEARPEMRHDGDTLKLGRQQSSGDLVRLAYQQLEPKGKIRYNWQTHRHIVRDGISVDAAGIYAGLSKLRTDEVPPILTGATVGEAKLFMVVDNRHVARSFWRGIQPWDPNYYKLVAGYLSKAAFIGGLGGASAQLDQADLSHVMSRVFRYEFDWDEEPIDGFANYALLIGGFHGSDVSFSTGEIAFGALEHAVLNEENRPRALLLAQHMGELWHNFISTGNPNNEHRDQTPDFSQESPLWQPLVPSQMTLILDSLRSGGFDMQQISESAEELLQLMATDERLDMATYPGAPDRCQILHEAVLLMGESAPQDPAPYTRLTC